MKNIFGMDSPFFLFISKVCDMVVLNVLWLLCCLPVFTIGASTAALYRCIEKMHKDEAAKIGRQFWKAFRGEFKQATALFGILFLIFLILIADIYIVFFEFEIGMVGQVLVCIFAFLIFPAACYVFPLQAHFENRVFRTLKNAWLMAMSHLPVSLVVAVINLLPAILLCFWPAVFYRTFIVWLLIGGSLIAHFSSILLRIVFRKYENQNSNE